MTLLHRTAWRAVRKQYAPMSGRQWVKLRKQLHRDAKAQWRVNALARLQQGTESEGQS